MTAGEMSFQFVPLRAAGTANRDALLRDLVARGQLVEVEVVNALRPNFRSVAYRLPKGGQP